MEKTITKENKNTANDILCAALDIGEHLLRSGGEIHRVENTIERICTHFGAAHVEVFAIPTLIIASIRLESGEFTQQMRRIYDASNNMKLLEDLNAISRKLCNDEIEIKDVDACVKAAKNKKAYPKWVIAIGNMVASSSFTIFFGGNFIDAITSAVIGLAIALFSWILPKSWNKMISILLSSTLAGLIAVFSYKLGLCDNYGMVMIGTVMLLIPGVAITNAMRDMLGGEAISGSLGLLQSLLLALMIAAGYAIALILV